MIIRGTPDFELALIIQEGTHCNLAKVLAEFHHGLSRSLGCDLIVELKFPYTFHPSSPETQSMESTKLRLFVHGILMLRDYMDQIVDLLVASPHHEVLKQCCIMVKDACICKNLISLAIGPCAAENASSSVFQTRESYLDKLHT